ncbi:carboxylate-amine ligase [Methylobacterium planeticum]|uniref:Putative glutamate--cysteine ligase 2 n=1 Tax=Methylobacterium planeticum TaxID=2615211 RepID=A0A6N6MUG0_9HYPH|nr:carboxylate-amine ligase [Methylobacterium planeticum]KAB1074358.1 carboxylate-amine ligase [Methylobacterium planeticum]
MAGTGAEADTYKFGIEEEFFLADAGTRGTPRETVEAFHEAAQAGLDSVSRELLQSQIEICTPPSGRFAEARARLQGLRTGLADLAARHDLLVFAAGTHPTATWANQAGTEAARYRGIMDDLRMIGQRTVVCGLHVHVEVPRPEARIDIANRLMPFLPALLALSTASPFWQGRRTGLMGYRLRAYAELPRTGLPELFDDAADYGRYVDVMTRAGAIADASFLWWHVRPSLKYPTLELRIADSCTRLDDTLAVAALYRCLVRLLERRPDLNARMTGASRGFVMENLWRAERDGVRAELIDAAAARAVPLAEGIEAILGLVEADADALGCRPECERARAIVAEGSSADRQVARYEAALGRGEAAALAEVVDGLARETAGAP